MCGSVKASQTTARAVALFDSARVCQLIATYQIPSPSSEIVLAVQSSLKSRLAKGARMRLNFVSRRGSLWGLPGATGADGRRPSAAPSQALHRRRRQG